MRSAVGFDDPHTVLLWVGGALKPAGEAPAGDLLAADSWLLDEGRVRGYERHWARFCGSCEELRVAPAELARFRAGVTAALPRAGRWFPRLDLVGRSGAPAGAPALLLRLRPAQPLRHGARVLIAEPGDPRTCPRRKGPDLALLQRLRADAVAAGADELVLRDAGGRLVEGALSSLLWWEGAALCSTPAEHTLPSVTRELLLEIARERDVEVRRRSPLPCELDGREVWLCNAAHGIRSVTSWHSPGPAAGAAERAAGWRAALDATALPVGGGPLSDHTAPG